MQGTAKSINFCLMYQKKFFSCHQEHHWGRDYQILITFIIVSVSLNWIVDINEYGV